MLTNLLSIENVSVIGVLIAGIVWLAKYNNKIMDKQEKASDDKFNYMKESLESENKRHKEEEIELKNEIKRLHEREEKRDAQWLSALNENTNQLENVADKLDVIPTLQKDMDNMQSDIKEIKEQLNGGK